MQMKEVKKSEWTQAQLKHANLTSNLHIHNLPTFFSSHNLPSILRTIHGYGFLSRYVSVFYFQFCFNALLTTILKSACWVSHQPACLLVCCLQPVKIQCIPCASGISDCNRDCQPLPCWNTFSASFITFWALETS